MRRYSFLKLSFFRIVCLCQVLLGVAAERPYGISFEVTGPASRHNNDDSSFVNTYLLNEDRQSQEFLIFLKPDSAVAGLRPFEFSLASKWCCCCGVYTRVQHSEIHSCDRLLIIPTALARDRHFNIIRAVFQVSATFSSWPRPGEGNETRNVESCVGLQGATPVRGSGKMFPRIRQFGFSVQRRSLDVNLCKF